MAKVLMDEESQIEIKHSKLGVLSVALSFMLGSYLSALYFTFVTYNNIKYKTFDSDLIFNQSIKFPLDVSIYIAGMGVILSLLGLLGKYKKRFYPLAGLIINTSIIYFTFKLINVVKSL